MSNVKQFLASLLIIATFAVPSAALAGGDAAVANSLVGAQGYDLVSYHQGGPKKGNGNHVAVHEGITYVFANEANQQSFEANPAKYLPAYGGYCAYGVSVGKKFVGDPNVWKVVDGTLYLNLDKKVQGIWNKDISGNIANADGKWSSIKDKAAFEL